MEEQQASGKIFPYGRTEIPAGEETAACPARGIAHHLECRNENGSCSAFG